VLRAVVARAREGGAGGLEGVALVVVYGFEDLSGVEAALLRAATDAVTAAGGRIVVTLPADDAARPWLFPRSARLRAAMRDRWGFAEVALPGFARAPAPSLARLATAVFAPPDPARPRVPADDALRSIVGADPADEIDRIGREILRLRRDGEIASFREVGSSRRLDGVGPAMPRAQRSGSPRGSTGNARLTSEAAVRAVRRPLALLAGDDEDEDDSTVLLDHLRWRALASGAVPDRARGRPRPPLAHRARARDVEPRGAGTSRRGPRPAAVAAALTGCARGRRS
jgi:hypothetical protein